MSNDKMCLQMQLGLIKKNYLKKKSTLSHGLLPWVFWQKAAKLLRWKVEFIDDRQKRY